MIQSENSNNLLMIIFFSRYSFEQRYSPELYFRHTFIHTAINNPFCIRIEESYSCISVPSFSFYLVCCCVPLAVNVNAAPTEWPGPPGARPVAKAFGLVRALPLELPQQNSRSRGCSSLWRKRSLWGRQHCCRFSEYWRHRSTGRPPIKEFYWRMFLLKSLIPVFLLSPLLHILCFHKA